jgi:hypothetical protein
MHYYQDIRRVAANETEIVGVVSMPEAAAEVVTKGFCDPLAIDNFLPVAGIHINCCRDIAGDEVYVCTSIKRMQMYGALRPNQSKWQSWLVYSNSEQGGDI